MSASPDSPRLQLAAISKRYPGCLANDRIDLSIAPGEIHALLGENGAGKSTLMKIIYGVTQPDSGEIRWPGQALKMRDPAMARSLGIGMVFQHFSLFETLTVAENIALAMGRKAGTPKQLEPKIREVSQRYGMALEPGRLVHSLSIGERQRVEIVRCLMQDIKLLILDEPTSVLTPQEAEELFVALRRLAAEGCGILFISHKLGEVRALCHSATVLRAGRVSGDCVPAERSDLGLARLMVGDAEGLESSYRKASGGRLRLRVDDLSRHNADPFGSSLSQIRLEVRSGEIVGLAGNGQDELLALLGHDPREALHTLLIDPVTDWYGVSELLVKALPILLCALGLAVAYQARIWNIGAEGQLLLGALAGGAMALQLIDWESRWALAWVVMATTLLRAMALALGIEREFFDKRFLEPISVLRMIHYPPRQAASSAEQQGAGAHTDYVCITLLNQDEAGGLQVRPRGGDWIDAPPIAGSFVVNIGDMMARWSNDRYTSTPHRVISPLGVDRYSMPFFAEPHPDTVIDCLPNCSSPDNPPKYSPVTSAEYLLSRFADTYAYRRWEGQAATRGA